VQQHLRLNALPEKWVLPGDHNLCFKYQNESCELILDIYVSRDFSMCIPTSKNALYQRSSEDMSEPYGPRVRVNPWPRHNPQNEARHSHSTNKMRSSKPNKTQPFPTSSPSPCSLHILTENRHNSKNCFVPMHDPSVTSHFSSQLPRPNFVSMDESHLLTKSFQLHDICNYL